MACFRCRCCASSASCHSSSSPFCREGRLERGWVGEKQRLLLLAFYVVKNPSKIMTPSKLWPLGSVPQHKRGLKCQGWAAPKKCEIAKSAFWCWDNVSSESAQNNLLKLYSFDLLIIPRGPVQSCRNAHIELPGRQICTKNVKSWKCGFWCLHNVFSESISNNLLKLYSFDLLLISRGSAQSWAEMHSCSCWAVKFALKMWSRENGSFCA